PTWPIACSWGSSGSRCESSSGSAISSSACSAGRRSPSSTRCSASPSPAGRIVAIGSRSSPSRSVSGGRSRLSAVWRAYVQLRLARLGVSAGEAGGSPPSLSYLADAFTPERRATVMAVYAIGAPAGALIATFAGGRIAQDSAAAFLVFGLSGILLAVVTRLTLRELRAPPAKAQQPALVAALRVLAAKRSYVHVCLAGAAASFALNFLTQYLTSFLT